MEMQQENKPTKMEMQQEKKPVEMELDDGKKEVEKLSVHPFTDAIMEEPLPDGAFNLCQQNTK
ncbi:hypothetical protein A2U01_0090821, partial [Trifolium medium]|nr:hypothetical protein [Trifolium medium]